MTAIFADVPGFANDPGASWRIARRMVAFAAIVLAMIGCGGGGGGGSSPAPTPLAAPSGLSYPAVPALEVGTALATPVVPAVTGTVTSYTVSPPLPAGLMLDAASGVIVGTPAAAAPTATYTVRAANSAGAATFALVITVLSGPPFRLEPIAGATIGVGQLIDIFGAFKANGSDPFPQYLDPQQVTLTSTQPGVAIVNNRGQVRGVAAGTTTIMATYQSLTSTMQIVVSGTYTERSLTVPGQGARQYAIYVPPGASGPRPLLLAIHGGGGTARIHASMTLLAKLGADNGALVVFPEGTGVIQTFNAGSCCGGAQTQNVDDVGFFSALLDDVQAHYPVDASRIYSSGFSNGGMMSYRLACTLADRIAGIAAVSGASGRLDLDGNVYYGCTPTRPIRVLHVHATNDRNYPYNGGFGEGLSDTNFHPVEATIAEWRTRNNVSSQARIEAAASSTTCFHYETALDSSRPSAPVTLCRSEPADNYDPATGIVFGGGHSWPGGSRSPSPGGDAPLLDFSANGYLWPYLTR